MTNQPKPEVKCEHKLNKNQMEQFGRDECTKCGEWVHLPSPASTEEWEKKFDEDEDFKQLFFGVNKSLYWTKSKLKDFIRSLLSSHDHQLRQRIVEEIKKELEPIGVCMEKADEKLRTGNLDQYDDESSLRQTVKECIEIMEPLERLLTFITNL